MTFNHVKVSLVLLSFLSAYPAKAAEESHRFSVPFNILDYEYVIPGLCRDVKLTVAGLNTWGTFCDTAVPQIAAQRAVRDFSSTEKLKVGDPKPDDTTQGDPK